MRFQPAVVNRLILVTLSGLLTWPVSAHCSDVVEILNRVAINPPAKVAFREERHNSMLQEPLVLNGYLEYLAPGQMRKVVETPYREVFTITDSAVEIERDGQNQKLSLRRSRSLKTLLSGIEAIISGDENQLMDSFELELHESDRDWSIRFTPRSRRVARNLEGLYVSGSDDVIVSIRVYLCDGEWQLIELQQDRDSS